MQDEKLIEEMCGTWRKHYWEANDNAFDSMKAVLSVIRQNVHLVAEYCDCFEDRGLGFEPYHSCKRCNGFGIIAKQERGAV